MGPAYPTNTSGLATSSIVFTASSSYDGAAETHNLSSVAVYQSTEQNLVMINIDPSNNLRAKPHINSNLLAAFSGSPETDIATKTAPPISQTPSSFIIAETSSSPVFLSTATVPTGIPTSVPQIIVPPNGVNISASLDSTLVDLVQIGFFYGLNYDFVNQHDASIDQIFTFLPQGIAYGLTIPVDQIVMQTLRAYDTMQNLSYVTTLAFFYMPQTLVTSLEHELQNSTSPLYQNPDASVRSIMSLINPAIPIQANSQLGTLETPPLGGKNEYTGVSFAVTYNAPNPLDSGQLYARLNVGDASGSPVTSVEDYVWHYSIGSPSGPFQPDRPGPGEYRTLEHCCLTPFSHIIHHLLPVYILNGHFLGVYADATFGADVSHARLMDNSTTLLYLLANGSVAVVLSDADGNATSSVPFSTPGSIPFSRFDASACGAEGMSLCVYYQENGTALAELSYDRAQRAWASPLYILF